MGTVNNMTFEQAATVLNSIYNQATGNAGLTATTTSDFVSQAQTVLKTGYDAVSNSISSVLSRTIFSIRPYSAKFKSLQVTNERWGNHVRKINYVDQGVSNDDRYSLTDGQSVDMYTVRKPKVLQTNWYGAEVYEDWVTIYKDQLDTAFTGPDQFAQFLSGVMQNMTDKLEQFREAQRRQTLLNFMAAKISLSSNVVHLLDEYYTETGVNLTTTTVRSPTYFADFVKWLYGYLQATAGLMSNRSINYHLNISGSEIMRHTPMDRLNVLINSQFLAAIGPEALSSVYQIEQMKDVNWEGVDFWQAINSPMAINITPNYLDVSDGAVKKAGSAVSESNVLGIMFDDEAMGLRDKSSWTMATSFNTRGAYYNQWYHLGTECFNDLTENAVILLLDHAAT